MAHATRPLCPHYLAYAAIRSSSARRAKRSRRRARLAWITSITSRPANRRTPILRRSSRYCFSVYPVKPSTMSKAYRCARVIVVPFVCVPLTLIPYHPGRVCQENLSVFLPARPGRSSRSLHTDTMAPRPGKANENYLIFFFK